MNRQQDNEMLIEETKHYAGKALRWLATTAPGIAVGIIGFHYEIALVAGISVAALLLIWSFGFREWRVQRSKRWYNSMEQQQEEELHQRDKAWLRYPALGAAIAAIGVIGYRELGSILSAAQNLL